MAKQITVENDNVYVNGNLIRNRPDYDAKDDYYQSVMEYFDKGKTCGNSHLSKIVGKVLKAADANVDKSSTMALNTLKLYSNIMGEAVDYFEGKKAVDADFIEYQLFKRLFPWQQNVMNDLSKRKLLICSRRTGKSYMEAFEMIKHCLKGTDDIQVGDRIVRKPRCAIYIGLTIAKAAAIMWDNLKALVTECRIPVNKIDNGALRITFANGAYIQLAGNSSKAEREKIRGSDWSLAIIDEAQSQNSLAYLFDSILEPIIGARNGTMIMSGTGPLYKGYWSKCIEHEIDGWNVHHYTIYDNPTISDPEAILDEEAAKLGGKDSTTFRREWLGEIAWDETLLIYPRLTYYDTIPNDFHPIKAYIGVDDGLVDGTAVCLILIDENRNGFVSDEFFKVGCSPTELENTLRAFQDNAIKTWRVQDVRIVADNHGKQMYQDFQNHGINNIEMAIKTDKNIHIAYLNEALASGRLKCKKGGFINDEAVQVCWKYDDENDRIVYEEDKRKYHQNMMDSLLYAWTNYEMNN